jgi:hypothetical protein
LENVVSFGNQLFEILKYKKITIIGGNLGASCFQVQASTFVEQYSIIDNISLLL